MNASVRVVYPSFLSQTGPVYLLRHHHHSLFLSDHHILSSTMSDIHLTFDIFDMKNGEDAIYDPKYA